ncbi:MAG: DUF4079 domain-containing protein [Gloeomargarita sp. GMQP_bins_120]
MQFLKFWDWLRLVHPTLAVVLVFPLVGMVTHLAWQTWQRRWQIGQGGESKIPPVVGPEHARLGRWLAGAVVGVTLVGILIPIGRHIAKNNIWSKNPTQVILIGLFFLATVAALVALYHAQKRVWRAVWATLTGMGLVVLGAQDGVWRRGFEWWVSHYYYGLTAALLMIFSLAIWPEIYQDRTHTWRRIHVLLNSLALLLFIGQGLTGTRDLLEIPLSWQEPAIYSCDFQNLTCPQAPPPP